MSLEQGKGYKSHAEGDTFERIQNVIGSEGDDVIVLGPENGSANPLGGKNLVATSGKSDTVTLGDGPNKIQVHALQKSLIVDKFDS